MSRTFSMNNGSGESVKTSVRWGWRRQIRGPRRILGAVTEPHALRRVLVPLGLAAEPPPGALSPPRDPPCTQLPGSLTRLRRSQRRPISTVF
jgi:hypothetical protein